MKVLFALHGYPPELVGGTENTVQAQARGLAARGVEVVVVAGSMDWEAGFRTSRDEDVDPKSGERYPVYRIHRDDLYFDHWQKSAQPRVARAFREILEAERPDVVHVQHWIRLSRDLIATAARAGIPAVVTLHDLWTTCLLAFRVQPGKAELCREAQGFRPCFACAGKHPPKTPWVSLEAGMVAYSEHAAEVARELDLARAVVTPSRAHAVAIEGFLGREPGSLDAIAIAPGRDLDVSRRAAAAPPAPVDGGQLVLGAWGHLHPIKGGDLVLEAVRALPDPGRVAVVFAGMEVLPEYGARLREAAAGLDVTFHGAFAADELSTHPVTAVHAMVSGSRAHESWGLVLDEAWAFGLPAIVPDVGAFSERLGPRGEERGGLLYDSGDVASLAAALGRLLDEPELLPRLRAGVPEHPCPTQAESLDALSSVYERAVAAGAPEPPADESLRDLVRVRALEEWDRSLERRTPAELGFEPPES